VVEIFFFLNPATDVPGFHFTEADNRFDPMQCSPKPIFGFPCEFVLFHGVFSPLL
jgi:hypothetical protein